MAPNIFKLVLYFLNTENWSLLIKSDPKLLKFIKVAKNIHYIIFYYYSKNNCLKWEEQIVINNSEINGYLIISHLDKISAISIEFIKLKSYH
jgi:hypothetical protein